ncbi:MAG: VTT domain-containing protein [Candidatus Acidiferrales bacterium]
MGGSWKDLLHNLYNVQELVRWGGTFLVCGVIFVETGLFVGFFLPGDSLLVAAGILAAAGQLNLYWLLVPVSLCAIVGDQLGYWIGRSMGQGLYRRKDSRFFKRRHLESAHAFYEKHGGKTIILARFAPIIRTFCPPVAGAARMSYARYVAYDIFGGIFWVCSMVLTGFFLGRTVPHIEKRIHFILAIVIVVSLIPAGLQALKAYRQRGTLANPGVNPPQN